MFDKTVDDVIKAPSPRADNGIDAGRGYRLDEIITICKRLRKRGDLKMREIDFLHAWDGLVYISDSLNEVWAGEDNRINSYLRTVRDAITHGERIGYSGLPTNKIEMGEDRVGKIKKFSELLPMGGL